MKWKDVFSPIRFRRNPARLRLAVKGRVQGVGFRPSVYRLAKRAGVSGYIRNTRHGVIVEIEGSHDAIDRFGESLLSDHPPLARIDSIEALEIEPIGSRDFTIEVSEEPGAAETLFPVDTAVCEDCLREMRDPADKRYRYPFINCTNCGPRFTIIEDLPYDRPMTTMKEFSMDYFCRSQYSDPGDRRFHAEPISCPDCGPHLTLIDREGAEMHGDPISEAQRLLREGSVVAVKGLGGYHLACLATEPRVVERLRERKRRPAKPFALMFRGIEVAERYCVVDEKERQLLLSPTSPIVILRRRGKQLPEEIAPHNGYIGAFLPYTPVHHLLMEVFDVLVMTSANFTDEPLISREDELREILRTIADAALVHDRCIAHKCDDSIFFVPAGTVVPIRRARGIVPEPIFLPKPSRTPVLALGGQEKGTFALTRGERVYLSPHLGDLGDIRSQRNFRRELEEFKRTLKIEPEACVHDMHPDYFTTRLAKEIDVPISIAVQHHHAHAVSVMVEHEIDEPVVAVTFDGTGFGSDGKLWGGEFLLSRYEDFERLARIKYLPLPGGEAAIREPWRMALVHLWNLHGSSLFDHPLPPTVSFDHLPARQVFELFTRGVNSPLSSSAGRLFDAVAFLLGCGERVSFEAEAASALETLALEAGDSRRRYRFDVSEGDIMEIDPAPVIGGIVADLTDGVSRQEIAAGFHVSLAVLIADLSVKLAKRWGCRAVVISGGVFQNRFLCESVMRLFESRDVRFYQHELAPPNDGGVSLGQAQVGSARIEKGLV